MSAAPPAALSPLRLVLLTLLALLAFAANSLLCRLALRHTAIDAASFTGLRLLAGALALGWLLRGRAEAEQQPGNWTSALALFSYAATFSWAYTRLPAGSGALLLFGAVQLSMLGFGLARGERLTRWQTLGLLLAAAGLVLLVSPGLAAPPLLGSASMALAGLSWAVYTLRGRGPGDALQVTAGNFSRAVWPAALLAALALLARWPAPAALDLAGLACAVASGALASGLGYAVWYTVLPRLRVTTAASVQLAVPLVAAVGGVVLLGERLDLRLLLATPAVLGGLALVLLSPRPAGA